MKTTTLIIAALGLACPIVAQAQGGLPLPDEVEVQREAAEAPGRMGLDRTQRVIFTFWPEGVVPRRSTRLTVDLRTGVAIASRGAPPFRRSRKVRLPKPVLARIRRAVIAATSARGRIDLPSLTLEAASGKTQVEYDWIARADLGSRWITLSEINNPAALRLGELMIRVTRGILRKPFKPRPKIWPRLGPKLPLVGVRGKSLMDRVRRAVHSYLARRPLGHAVRSAIAGLWDRVRSKTVSRSKAADQVDKPPERQRKGMIGAFGPR